MINFAKKIINFHFFEKKFSPSGRPPLGKLLKRRAVSDGRLRRGLTVTAEHTQNVFYTHITSIWSEADSLLGQRWRLFGLKKKIPPAAGTLIGNLLERRAGLRRPTVSGLNCDRRTPPWHVLYTHITSIWSGADSVLSQRWWKIVYFTIYCLIPPKGSLYPITSEHRNLSF